MIKNIIVRVLKKVTAKLDKGGLQETEGLEKAASSILLPGTTTRFTTKKENRVYVQMGERCLIGGTFLFETETGKVNIGNNVHIGNAFCICRTAITIEDDVVMAWGITLYDHNSHSIYWEERQKDNDNCYADYIKHNGNNIVNKDWSNVVSKPIHICSKAWIGFNVTILKGVTIGEGAVVGACSVVTKDVEPWTVVGGNPAQVIKRLK